MSDVIHFALHALHFVGIGLLIIACFAGTYAFLYVLFDPLIKDIERKEREYERLVTERDREFQYRRAIADAYIAESQARSEMRKAMAHE